MSLFKSIRRVYLTGICGTAMASLAGMLKESGFEVMGSDANVYPPMSTELARLGIPVYNGYRHENLDCHPDLVVIGNALSRGNPEIERILDEGLRYCSMPEAVRELFIRGRTSIVVAGTHGKTTTASMLAWLYEYAGLKPNFLIGGIARNFGKSYQLGGGPHFIIEGDEYDTAFFDKGPKFLHYLPHIVLLNNIEFDHADIYPNLAAVTLSFRRLVNIIPGKGRLMANWNDPMVREVSQSAFCKVNGFAVLERSGVIFNGDDRKTDYTAQNVHAQPEGTSFTVYRRGESLGEFLIPLFGDFNVSNAVGAIATAAECGINPEAIKEALRKFQSVRRRMEIRGCVGGMTIIDDFGHHPTAIRQTLLGIRACFPGARLWAIVEPRSATMRRSVSEQELIRALIYADEIVIAELYSPDKIAPEERLSPQRVVESLRQAGKSSRFLPTASDIVRGCSPLARPGDVFVVFSNGGFDNIHEKLLEALTKERVSA